ncbi:hypothetical protein [Nonomuraea sp. NPDC049709]|uniref:hypothetical protein n=1 Tax=Nonomuraea sp. NPDC049709 TaxID=3154736 RepID=UPI00342A587E
MLDYDQRITRYTAQTGRTAGDPVMRLTPRQLRRVLHKLGHQQAEAIARREERSAARQVARRKRDQERRSGATLPKPVSR